MHGWYNVHVRTAVFRVLASQCLERKYLSRDIFVTLHHTNINIAESGKCFYSDL